jgi:hypothetical protein
VLKGALQVLPGSSQAHFGLSRLYRAQGTYAEAARELESATAGALVNRDALLDMLGESLWDPGRLRSRADADIARSISIRTTPRHIAAWATPIFARTAMTRR